MGYIGRGPVKSGAFRIIDDIASSFNGSTTAFTLQHNSSNLTPGTEQNLLLAIDGVMQEPVDAFTISGSTITFTSAPASGASFWGVELGDVGGITSTVANGTVDTAQLAADAVDSTKIEDNSINSEHYVDGSIDLAHMSANSIDSDQYVDGSIDLAHMSVNSIDSDQYVDGSIDTVHIGDNQVTLAKLDNTARETNIQLVVVDFATALTTGNGKFYFYVPATLNGFNIVAVHAEVITAPAGSVATFMLHNVTSGADILSTAITIDAGETGSDSAATAAVISSSEDDLTTHDIIRVDIDGVGSGTAGSGLIINMTCRLP